MHSVNLSEDLSLISQANARGLVAACTVLTAQYGLEQQPMTVGITAVAAWMDIHPGGSLSLRTTLASVRMIVMTTATNEVHIKLLYMTQLQA